MHLTNSSTPFRVVEASTGAHFAQAASLWLRAPRDAAAWRINATEILLAFDGALPVAVAEVRAAQFSGRGITRFAVAPGRDAAPLRAAMVDFLRNGSSRGTRHLTAA